MVFLIIALGLAIAVGVSTFVISNASDDIARIHQKKADALGVIDEMRQSSDDLTNMARLYAQTRRPVFLDSFDTVLEIRAGEASRPADYEKVYWDLAFMGTPPGDASDAAALSLVDQFNRTQFTIEERLWLNESLRRSNALALIVDGAFRKIGIETEQARAELSSDDYIEAKANIMEPVRQAQVSVDTRTTEALDSAMTRLDRAVIVATIAAALLIVVLGAAVALAVFRP